MAKSRLVRVITFEMDDENSKDELGHSKMMMTVLTGGWVSA